MFSVKLLRGRWTLQQQINAFIFKFIFIELTGGNITSIILFFKYDREYFLVDLPSYTIEVCMKIFQKQKLKSFIQSNNTTPQSSYPTKSVTNRG